MHHKKLTILKGNYPLSGELLFDDHRICFRNDPLIPAFIMVALLIMTVSNGYLSQQHVYDDSAFYYTVHGSIAVISLLMCILSAQKFFQARKTHMKEINPKDIDLVYLLRGKRQIEFVFDFNNGKQQTFKTKISSKSEYFISFLRSSNIDVL
jgi:hypothetical protein